MSAADTKRSPAIVQTRIDGYRLTITLPKSSSVALTRARDVCAALAASTPVLQAKAGGIKKALDGLIDDIKKPIPLPEPEEQSETA